MTGCTLSSRFASDEFSSVSACVKHTVPSALPSTPLPIIETMALRDTVRSCARAQQEEGRA